MSSRRPKARTHQRLPSHLVSDYESDAPPANPPPVRTNTELNLSVLRRYNPAITSILSIAANAVVYHFSTGSQSWEKSGLDGTMFVCQEAQGYCLVILNRRGLENLIVEIEQADHVEVTTELLILRLPDRVMGIWIHADKDDTRELNYALIKQCFDASRCE